jgi:hypothetical protein
MRISGPVALCTVVLLCTGCGSGTNKTPQGGTPGAGASAAAAPGAGKPFLDERKEVGPRLEWNREVTSRKGGTIAFRVDSQGPFAVSLVTDKGYKALQGGDKKSFKKDYVLLTVDSKGPSYEGKATIPTGSSYFIIENQTGKKVEFHLQCSDAD